jgi:cell division transport system permease protein
MADPRQPQRSWRQRARLRLEQTLAATLQAVRRLRHRRLATLLTAAVIGSALVLPGCLFYLGTLDSDFSRRLDAAREVSVYLRSGSSDGEALALTRALASRSDVKGARYISPADGLAEFRRWSGLGATVDALGRNPLPGAIIIEPRADASDAAGLERLSADLRRMPVITDVQTNAIWIRRYASLIQMLHRLGGTLGLLLCGSVLLTVSNTIRLQIEAVRDEIEILALVGADAAYIRRPFVLTGIGYGLLGGLIAIALLTGFILLLRQPVTELSLAYGGLIRWTLPSNRLCWALLLCSGGLSGVAAWAAASLQLRQLSHKVIEPA